MKAKIIKYIDSKGFIFIRKYKNTKQRYFLYMKGLVKCLNIIDLCYWDDKIEGWEFIESFKSWYPLKIHRRQK